MNKRLIGRLGLKLLWRDWRGGELNIIVVALLVSVTTVTGIGLFSDRIQNSIIDEASSLLAADAQITGSQPIPSDWLQAAHQDHLQTAQMTGFQSMAFGHDDAMQLASIKAVSERYPLKGQVEVTDQPFGEARKVAHGPAVGDAWVNSRLMASLGLQLGDQIGIGDANFTVSQVLVREPDDAGSGFGLSPRILINRADVARTKAVQVGSRVRYSLLLAGDVEPFHHHWQQLQTPHHRWRSVENANERVGDTLQRASSFLLLAGSLGVILAGVALALAARRYAARQLAHVALLKTLGLQPRDIAYLYSGSLALLAGLTVVAGLALGWFLHWAFLAAFSGLLPRELAAPTVRPLLVGLITGITCLLAFALPPIWALRRTPPARVLRHNVAGGTLTQWHTTLLGASAVIGLVLLYSENLLLTAILLLAGVAAVVGVAMLARALIYLSRRAGSGLGATWRLGLASLQRHSQQNSFQIMIFAIALMLLFMLTLVRTSLLQEWQNQLPKGTPNHFAFNIFADEKAGFEQFLRMHQISSTPMYPMLRGRLTAVNAEPIQNRLERLRPEGDDYRRELNNTWSTTLAADNEVVQGAWFSKADQNRMRVSVEQEFAKNLHIELGDQLTFSFGGQTVVAAVESIRKVHWDSMAPNFYIIFNKPILNGVGAAYLTSFYLTDAQKPLLVDLLHKYPTVSIVEVDIILQQIQSIIEKVTFAIEFILALVLLSGAVVLVASIQATLDSRLQESAILRTLGANARVVQGALAIEFFTLGALAGLLAALCAQIALYFLQTELLNIAFVPSMILLLIGPVIGALAIGGVGLLSTRRVVKVPPLTVLRTL